MVHLIKSFLLVGAVSFVASFSVRSVESAKFRRVLNYLLKSWHIFLISSVHGEEEEVSIGLFLLWLTDPSILHAEQEMINEWRNHPCFLWVGKTIYGIELAGRKLLIKHTVALNTSVGLNICITSECGEPNLGVLNRIKVLVSVEWGWVLFFGSRSKLILWRRILLYLWRGGSSCWNILYPLVSHWSPK